MGARVGIGALLVDLADDDERAFGVAATEVRRIHTQLAQGVGRGLGELAGDKIRVNAVEKRQIDLVGYLHELALGVIPLELHAHADVVKKPVALEVYIAKELEPDAEIAEVGLNFLVAVKERDLVG